MKPLKPLKGIKVSKQSKPTKSKAAAVAASPVADGAPESSAPVGKVCLDVWIQDTYKTHTEQIQISVMNCAGC